MPRKGKKNEAPTRAMTLAHRLMRDVIAIETELSPKIYPRKLVFKYFETLYPQLDEFSRELLFEQLIDIARRELKKNSERLTGQQFELDLSIYLPLCVSVPGSGTN